MTLETKDLGLGKIRDLLEELKTVSVTFGYQGASGEAKHPGADVSVATVAAFQEFGTINTSPRPFGRVTMERNVEAFAEAQRKALADVIDGRKTDAFDVVLPIGILAVRELRKTIDMSREWAEANADSTVRRKGHDQPLVGEYGTLYSAATYAIRVNGMIEKQGDGT